ncbi:hypothetical protein CRG98_035278 [Punica granatum]|uniref:Uncharacterized protein n=1 Tax=Punica granatum TaxID=22663 RepID=A0A2I0IK08_PUNGR|nr:hypothetical protein CRG98_035278 [Punica granatum]
MVLLLLSRTFILTRERFFQCYELLSTSCNISKVLRRCNNETLLEPPFPRLLWKADIASRGVKLSILVATLKKRSYHAQSVSPPLYSMVHSLLRSRFPCRVAANLWMNNSCSCLKLVIEPGASERNQLEAILALDDPVEPRSSRVVVVAGLDKPTAPNCWMPPVVEDLEPLESCLSRLERWPHF